MDQTGSADPGRRDTRAIHTAAQHVPAMHTAAMGSPESLGSFPDSPRHATTHGGRISHAGNPYKSALDLPPIRTSAVRQAIEQALLGIEQESGRSAGDTPVTLLCRRAHVARSTFYANYRTTDDVQRAVELRLLHTIINDGSTLTGMGTDGAVEAFGRVTALAEENSTLFRLLVVDVPDERFLHDWRQALCAHLWDRLFGRRTPHAPSGTPQDTPVTAGTQPTTDTPSMADAPTTASPAAQPSHRLPSTVNRRLMVEMAAGLMISFVTYRLEHPGEVSMKEIDALLPRLIAALDEIW